MKHIFDNVTLGGIESRNRLVRSATMECTAPDGTLAAENLLPIYDALGKGGVGIIITGMVGVDGYSRALPSMIKAYDESFASQLRVVVDHVHSLGAKIIVQLSHCGAAAGHIDSGAHPMGPSPQGSQVKGMTESDISKVVEAFAHAALRCKEAGADGVQLHAAHGLLFNQFLSPLFNRRQDSYGGDIACRSKLVFDVFQAVRSHVEMDFPVWIKINSQDGVEGGLTASESQWVCAELAKRGIDAIEVSGGLATDTKSTPLHPVRSPKDEGRFGETALGIADNTDATVISVCGYRTPAIIEEWLNRGRIEGIALSRPLICEPALPHRWQNGDRRIARCISCNKCGRHENEYGCPMFNNGN